MIKFKIFDILTATSDEINAFVASVKVLQEGIQLVGTTLLLMYREKDDIGMTADAIISHLVGELKNGEAAYIKNAIQLSNEEVVLATFDGSDELKKNKEEYIESLKAEAEAKAAMIRGVRALITKAQAGDFKLPV